MSNKKGTSKDLPPSSNKNNTTKQNGQASVEVGEEKKSDEYIRIRVVTSNRAHRLLLRMKRIKTLKRLKQVTCDRLNYEVNEHFFFFGEHLVLDEDTPIRLGMMDNDVFELY